jgi:hypothetical protein
MISNTMLKKRLRVFENISNENDQEDEEIFNMFNEKRRNNPFDFSSVRNAICPMAMDKLKSNLNKEALNIQSECFESNSIILTLPYNISEETILSILIIYGEVEFLKNRIIENKQNPTE